MPKVFDMVNADDRGEGVRVVVRPNHSITLIAFVDDGEGNRMVVGRLDWDKDELFAQADARHGLTIAEQMANAIQLDHLTDEQVDALHDALDVNPYDR